MTESTMRRLRDLPGIMALEYKAQIDPRMAADSARDVFDELDATSLQLFGVISDDVEFEWPEDEEGRAQLADLFGSEAEQVAAFRARGWDVTDERGRPLLVLTHFSYQLIGVLAGAIEIQTGRTAEAWASGLEREAAAFRTAKR